MGVTMIGVISMAPFPDIDLYLDVPHRGPTHSIWFASLVGFVYALILMYSDISHLSLLETIAIGFLSGFVGVIGHMIGTWVHQWASLPLNRYLHSM